MEVLTILVLALTAVTTFFLAGGKEDYDPHVIALWERVDRSFSGFVEELRARRAAEVADRIASFFGFATGVMFLASVIVMVAGTPPPLAFSVMFVYSFMVWQGIIWYTRAEHWRHTEQIASLSLMVLGMPLIDTLLGSNLTTTAAQPLDQISDLFFGTSVTGLGNIWLIGAVQFGVFFVGGMLMVAMMHIIFMPVMLSAVFIALISIFSARFFYSASHKRPLRPFMVVVAVLCAVFFAYK
ncbi:MAG: hypothetical protein HQL39_05850 [Alphaproteobacteria bacterium]|nr:hypothetical protein [Alphaproteobacteria bacterium]